MPCLFVEQLTVIDCAFLDATRGLLGDSWIVDIALEGALDAQSMVLDFGQVKRRLKRAVDDHTDHRLLVPKRSPALNLQARAGLAELEFRSDTGTIEHRSPSAAIAIIDTTHITADAIIAHLLPALKAVLPDSVDHIALTLRQETIDGASYRYCHGLKKHDGHCQRIAHGHRSRLQIRVDGQRDAALEQQFAKRWNDIYLGSREDLLTCVNGQLRFGYASAEGRFELSLPETRCDLLDGDTTVECIAEHLAHQAARTEKAARIEVRAYEGVMKGAIASATRHI